MWRDGPIFCPPTPLFLARAQPGQIAFSSAGVGATSHMATSHYHCLAAFGCLATSHNHLLATSHPATITTRLLLVALSPATSHYRLLATGHYHLLATGHYHPPATMVAAVLVVSLSS